jgi:class 3 adenylate cyclase/tetratricopeptide (TPR) repeat protein
VLICPGCGEENPEKFRICGMCGTPLHQSAPPPEVRKTVTIVFSDLKGSTNLGETLDSEALREVLTRYFDEMKRVLEHHGGTVEKFIGDAVMAVFGMPTLHEDDALRAVRAALEMKATLAELNRELDRRWGVVLSNRTGVNTGEVVAGDPVGGQRLVTGDTVNVAARLEQACPELEILIGEPTYLLVRDAVQVEEVEPLELKGKSERVPAYRLISAGGIEMLRRHHEAPLVGRREELRTLRAALEAAASTTTCRLAVVVAQPGVGKSRLLLEFVDSVGSDVTVLEGRCLSYGHGITFWPLAEVVRQASGIGEDDDPDTALGRLTALAGDRGIAERVGSLIGLVPETFAVEETFWGVRRLFETIAAERPLVVRLEDLHWAEPSLLKLIEHLLHAVEAPVVIIGSARPELLDGPAGPWVDSDAVLLHLQPLTAEDTAQVVEAILGGVLDETVRGRVFEAAGGNPLFVEQMLSMLVDAGHIRHADDGWVPTVDLSDLEAPPSIQALLAARLDRLSPGERGTVEPASVIGQVFYRGAVRHLAADDVVPEVDPGLDALVRKQFVAPDPEHFHGEDGFRFHHILIRDAAYQGILKRRRADLHERFAGWMDSITGLRAAEYEEIVAYHLEQAFQYREGLGPLDAHGLDLGGRAAERLASAGRRAVGRGDIFAAASLLGRATSTLPPDDARRLRLLVELADVLLEQGEFAEADQALDQAIEGAEAADDVQLAAAASLGRLAVRFATDPEELDDEVLAEAARAIPVFEAADDHAGLARVWGLLAQVHGTAARFGEAEAAIERTIHHARLAGDAELEMRSHAPYAIAALSGPMPVPAAIARCEELLRETDGDRRTEGVVLCALAQLHAMQGEHDDARALYARARAMLEELGVHVLAASVSLDSGPVELMAGNPAAAERELRRDHDVLSALGEKYLLSTMTGYLARAVQLQGRLDEALELAGLCEELSVEEDMESQALIRAVRAKVFAARGDHENARTLAREGVEFVRRTDSPVMQADALLDLGEVLGAGGMADEAIDATAKALALYEQKGHVVGATAARRVLERLRVGGQHVAR